jgi:hypothetical protein
MANSKLIVISALKQDVDMSAAEDRKPLELDDRDREALELFRSPGPARWALSLAAGASLEGEVHEAEVQVALLRVGLRRVLFVVQESGADEAVYKNLLKVWSAYLPRNPSEHPRITSVGGFSPRPSGITPEHATRLIEEGLRMEAHPGILFKDGPAGRRPAIADGPDVWEVIQFIREVDERGAAALDSAAEMFNLDPRQVNAAFSYYGDYKDEIDDWIARANETSEHAEKAWMAQQELIS